MRRAAGAAAISEDGPSAADFGETLLDDLDLEDESVLAGMIEFATEGSRANVQAPG